MGEFSKPTGDLSRMNVVQFNGAMRNLYGALTSKEVKTIAFVRPHQRHKISTFFGIEDPNFDFDRVIYQTYELVQRHSFFGRTEKYSAQKTEKVADSIVNPFVVRCVEFWQPRRHEPDNQNRSRDIHAEWLFGTN